MSTPSCDIGNDYDGRLGLRVASIFIIWFGSTVGAVFPVFANNNKSLGVPQWAFFIAKFFGSGVIIATAFVHLLSPAEDALRNPCLTGPITDYDWVSGIVLMVVFVMFFLEFMIMRYGSFGEMDSHDHQGGHAKPLSPSTMETSVGDEIVTTQYQDKEERTTNHVPGDDHLGHAREHNDIEEASNPFTMEDYRAQLTAVFILEFGVVFHSVFVGLTLAVAGEEFITLFIVLIFHQTFEGLGLGSRLAVTPWPKSKRWTPYMLAIAYGFSTPIAIAVGLGVRKTYPPGSQTTLIVNGVFDSISAGILIYTGLIELMAHEFMFSPSMRETKITTVLAAMLLMCMGAGLMALLGKWA